MKIKNNYQAVVLGLTLAITAPTDAQAAKVIDMVESMSWSLTQSQLNRAKKEAVKNAKAEGALPKREVKGMHATKVKSIWRLL